MDTNALVKEQLEDGEKLLRLLPQHGFDPAAACWLLTSYDGRWRFYMVSPLVETEGINVAYLRLAEAMRPILDELSTFDLTSVRLVGTTQPLGRDLLAALQRVPIRRTRPFRWKGIWLGERALDNAYFYPLPAWHLSNSNPPTVGS